MGKNWENEAQKIGCLARKAVKALGKGSCISGPTRTLFQSHQHSEQMLY